MVFPFRVFRRICSLYRRFFYKLLSDAKFEGSPLCATPLLLQGCGVVHFGKNVHIGLLDDTDFWTSYVFMNPRKYDSSISFGNSCWVGNHFVAISEGPGIFIGENTIIGTRVEIYDSDFHTVKPNVRLLDLPKREQVKIGNDVWIGNNVLILKGSEIGDHCVVAAGAVVSGKFPANVIIGGVPAKIIRAIGDINK